MKRPPQIKVTVSKHNSTDYWAVHIDDKLAVVALLRGLLRIASRKHAQLAVEKALSAPEAENAKLEAALAKLEKIKAALPEAHGTKASVEYPEPDQQWMILDINGPVVTRCCNVPLSLP